MISDPSTTERCPGQATGDSPSPSYGSAAIGVNALDVRPLSRSDHDRFANEWTKVQAEFVDAPAEAVSDADSLIQQVMTTRGYPVEDFDRRAADVSVEHPEVVENYRQRTRSP